MTDHCRTWRVIESFTQGKSDTHSTFYPDHLSDDAPWSSVHNSGSSKNEDAIVITPHFAVVLDGVTDKSPSSPSHTSIVSEESCGHEENTTADDSYGENYRKPNDDMEKEKESPGRFASRILSQTFCDNSIIHPTMTFREVLDVLTTVLDDAIQQQRSFPIQTTSTRPAVGAILVYSATRNELWRLGDGSYRLDDSNICHGYKEIDELTAHVRSIRLEMALLSGESSLMGIGQKNDIGRECILPLLQNQHVFCNVSVAEDIACDSNKNKEQQTALKKKYGYGCLNGTHIPDRYLEIISIPADTLEIVMSTDGYPCVENTLEKSEKILQKILTADPLCFRIYKSTKGIMEGNVSYDDRAYLRIALGARSVEVDGLEKNFRHKHQTKDDDNSSNSAQDLNGLFDKHK